MARVFFQENQFKQILPSSFPEGKFEKIITLQAPDLYPDYYVIPFKKKVVSPHGNSTPDLVFIAKDYKDWYVVEVEMSYHPYTSHVEPQVRNLAAAKYDDPEIIGYLCRKCDSLDSTRISALVRNEPVKILLILNEMQDEWASDLKNKYGAITSVFEIFHNSHSGFQINPPHRAYRVSRNYPIYSVSVTTTCSMHPHLTSLGVDDNSVLQLNPGDEIILEYNNCVTFWKVIEGPGATVWLIMDGRDEFINKSKTYQITKLRDNSLLLDII